MRTRRHYGKQRVVRFEVTGDCLVRTTTHPADGRSYVHRCGAEAFRDVAYAFEEMARANDDDVSTEELATKLNLPQTQVDVAVAFLVERGCVDKRSRLNVPAAGYVYEDALIEYHALREKGAEPEEA